MMMTIYKLVLIVCEDRILTMAMALEVFKVL